MKKHDVEEAFEDVEDEAARVAVKIAEACNGHTAPAIYGAMGLIIGRIAALTDGPPLSLIIGAISDLATEEINEGTTH